MARDANAAVRTYSDLGSRAPQFSGGALDSPWPPLSASARDATICADLWRRPGMIAARLIVILLGVIVPSLTHAQTARIALVIGNGRYLHTPQLANPANDARELAKT